MNLHSSLSASFRGAALALLFSTSSLASAQSGSWYKPEQSGHGLAVDQLSPDSALLLWFTYDFAGNPMPIYSEAMRQGGAFAGPAYAPYGPRFNDFDPADLIFEPWGRLSFAPQGCANATLAWESPLGDGGQAFGTGSVALRPLADACTPRAPAPLAGLSGTWRHAQMQGASLNVQVLDAGHALIYWYTYDQAGQPLPLYIEADIDGTRLTGRALSPRGMRFGSFLHADLGVQDLGEVSLEFASCDRATFAYETSLGSGSFPVARLTQPLGTACALPSAVPAGIAQRLEGRLDAGVPGFESVSLLRNSRDELFAYISYSGVYRGSFFLRDGRTWLELRREDESGTARFGRVLSGPVQFDAATGRLNGALQDDAGRSGILSLEADPRDEGQPPITDALALLRDSVWGEDKCYAFVCFARTDVNGDLEFSTTEFGGATFRGRIRNLDPATRVFDFDGRITYGNVRVVGSGRIEYGEPPRPGAPAPLKLLLLGTGANGEIFHRLDRVP